MIDYLTRHDYIQVGVTFSGFLLLLVAQIAVTAALFRSHVLPVWVPILFVVGAVLEVAFGSGGVPFALATISQTIATVAIGWAAHRKSVV